MKEKKMAALLLALMVAAQVVGCGNTTEKSERTSQNSMQTNAQQSETQNEKNNTVQMAQESDSNSKEERQQVSQ